MASLKILHTNDLHGKLHDGMMPQLLQARAECDLYFDTGDCIKTGNLGIPLKEETVWQFLNQARCSASCPGNRESHIWEKAMKSKVEGASQPILCANLYNRNEQRIFAPNAILEAGSWTIGVFGVMVPMVTKRMKSQAASQLLWTDPLTEAKEQVASLSSRCDLLIALTHIGFQRDLTLAEKVQGIDIILGGHSHTVLNSPTKINETYICQGGSHGRYLGKYSWSKGELTGGLIPWQAT